MKLVAIQDNVLINPDHIVSVELRVVKKDKSIIVNTLKGNFTLTKPLEDFLKEVNVSDIHPFEQFWSL